MTLEKTGNFAFCKETKCRNKSGFSEGGNSILAHVLLQYVCTHLLLNLFQKKSLHVAALIIKPKTVEKTKKRSTAQRNMALKLFIVKCINNGYQKWKEHRF